MKKILIILFTGIVFLVYFNTNIFAAVDNNESQPAAETEESLDLKVNNNLTITPEPEAQWLLGQVVSADAQDKTLVIKYPDYESDSEKNITIFAGENTTYENVLSLTEIKADDMISVDYIIDSEGKNIARSVSLEKLESERILEEGAKENSTEIEP